MYQTIETQKQVCNSFLALFSHVFLGFCKYHILCLLEDSRIVAPPPSSDTQHNLLHLKSLVISLLLVLDYAVFS